MMKQLLIAGAILMSGYCVKAQQSISTAQFQRDFVKIEVPKTFQNNSPELVISPIAFNEEKYRKFKKMRTAGIVLTGVGAGLMTTGIILMSDGVNDNDYYGYNDDYDFYDDSPGDGKIIGGAVAFVTGFLSTGGGITMWAIGSRKMKKYGGGNMYLKSTKNGVGVAYSF